MIYCTLNYKVVVFEIISGVFFVFCGFLGRICFEFVFFGFFREVYDYGKRSLSFWRSFL